MDIYLVVYSYEMNNPQINPFADEEYAKEHFFAIAKEQNLKHKLDLSSPLDNFDLTEYGESLYIEKHKI